MAGVTGARMCRDIGGAVAATALVAVLASCSGGTTHGHGSDSIPHLPTGSGTLGTPNAQCAQLAATAQQITAAETALYSGDQHALSTLDAALTAIRPTAPADVQSAIDRLNSGFHSASDLLAHPTAANKQKLSALAPQLAHDGMTVTSYATSTCGH